LKIYNIFGTPITRHHNYISMDDLQYLLPRTEEAYLSSRVFEQITWYDRKSRGNKRIFFLCKVTEIMLALLIPFLTGYLSVAEGGVRAVIGILGVLIAALSGLITLVKCQENWIAYRTIAESLKLEKYLFLLKAGPYQTGEAFPLFVERFESHISDSTKKWISYVTREHEKKPDQH
jgi:hypothetical protein